MDASFYFYDLETSGFRPKTARIMQFAGQRADLDLNETGQAYSSLIKLTADVLPDPDALLLTGILPQETLKKGLTEADFLKLFYSQIVKPGTIFVGYNNIRFDDEFIRYLNYRNFYDPYQWHWQDKTSRWDMLDVVRMVRALRPEGIKWPFNPDGKPTNRLEYLTSLNGLEHALAHDALSDVKAVLALARLIKSNQPKLFSFLLGMRHKKEVAQLVKANQPFIYTSSHYSSDYLHTTAVIQLASSGTDASLVYDLRFDPRPFAKLDSSDLALAWRSRQPDRLRLPIKTLKFNRCPALAPLSVLDKKAEQRLKLPHALIEQNLKHFQQVAPLLSRKMVGVVKQLDKERAAQQLTLAYDPLTIDERLYDDFLPDSDRRSLAKLRSTQPGDLVSWVDQLEDGRLKLLLPLYQARNFPSSLSPKELIAWRDYCRQVLDRGGRASRRQLYFSRLNDLRQTEKNRQRLELIDKLLAYGRALEPTG